MRVGGPRVSIVLALVAGCITRALADDCQDQLEAANTPVDVAQGSIRITDSHKITPLCLPVVFSDLFPSQACNLNKFPALGSATPAAPHLLRQASLVALQRVERASNLNQLALSPAQQALSASVEDIKAVSGLILGRIAQFVDPDCSTAVTWTRDPLKQKLDDFVAVASLRRILTSISPRKGIFWPQEVGNPVTLLERQDTRYFISSLISDHNTNCLLLLISDLQSALSAIIDSAQPSDATAAVSTAVTTSTQPTLPTTTKPVLVIAPTKPVLVITPTSRPAVKPTVSTPPPQSPSNPASPGSSEEEQEESGQEPPETEDEKLLREGREEFADYLLNSPEDFHAQAIRSLAQLKRLGRLPTVEEWEASTRANLAKQSALSGNQAGLNGLSQLERERVNNPIFDKFDARSTGQATQSSLGHEQDQSTAIVAVADAIQQLNHSYLQDKILLSQRVSELSLVVDNLLKQARDSQATVPSSTLQVQINSLNNLLTEHLAECNKQSPVQAQSPDSAGAFYTFKSLNEVLGLLKNFISGYKLYRATAFNWNSPTVARVPRTSGAEDLPNKKPSKKWFKKLLRSGNIFKDTLQNSVALNQIFSALNANSKIIKEFHPNKESYQPTDIAKETNRIYGSVVSGGDLKDTGKSESFYDKVIASIRKKYPNLSECCVIAWFACACTSVGAGVAILICCVNFCCVCRRGDCTPCCQAKGVKDSCASLCGCVEPAHEQDGAASQPIGYSRAQRNPNIRQSRDSHLSVQRDGTQSGQRLVHSSEAAPRGVKDYSDSNWQQVLPGQQQSHF